MERIPCMERQENFQAEMQLSNGQWMHMTAQKSPQEAV